MARTTELEPVVAAGEAQLRGGPVGDLTPANQGIELDPSGQMSSRMSAVARGLTEDQLELLMFDPDANG